jgi:molecular chaperone GrpE
MIVEDPDIETGVVVEVFKKGYIYKDRVVRHSMVKVAK